ncbi:cupin domain-containing protein [Viridibacillus sp. FSL E2-0187]|uniref:cupin domain-containing protein n=1 Tax=Viridibacillus sp. FSL E2-0187 TaxID=2921362 RepID=UPI0030FBFC10
MELYLNEIIQSTTKSLKFWESKDKNHRLLYFQIDPQNDGIPAHFHPLGEDYAIVVDGEMLYDISFDTQITVSENEIAFGWQHFVHGYHNRSNFPLHIIIFATPENNPSIYNEVENKTCFDEKVRVQNLTNNFNTMESNFIKFSIVQGDLAIKNCILYDWQNKKIIFPTETTEYILNKEGYLQIVFK